MTTNERQTKSKRRVRDHGEVFTAEREVSAMLDLVKNETERIDSCFLEPACGNGNFLIKILERKLNVVNGAYKRSQWDWEIHAMVAASSLYGVELLFDNVTECQNRLFDYFKQRYKTLYKTKISNRFLESVLYIFQKNLDIYVALQVKERNAKNQGKSDEDWLDSVVYGEAVDQIQETIKAIRTNSIKVNDLYHQPVQLNSNYSVCPIIIFDNPSVKQYKRLVYINSEQNTSVKVFSISDYKTMMEALVHPYDIIFYLYQRESWLKSTQGLPNIAIGDGENISIISRIDTEEDFALFFDRLDYDGNSKRKEDALRLLAIINKFRENELKKMPGLQDYFATSTKNTAQNCK